MSKRKAMTCNRCKNIMHMGKSIFCEATGKKLEESHLDFDRCLVCAGTFRKKEYIK